MYGALDISTSGLIVQRTRLEAHTQNIINANTIADGQGKNVPFARRMVFIAAGDPSGRSAAARAGGVHVASIGKDATTQVRHDPRNELADSNGYVKYPNINSAFEMMNVYDAQRAYEANLVAAEASKTMMAQALRLLA